MTQVVGISVGLIAIHLVLLLCKRGRQISRWLSAHCCHKRGYHPPQMDIEAETQMCSEEGEQVPLQSMEEQLEVEEESDPEDSKAAASLEILECSICRDEDDPEPLIRPCKCKGEVHARCLQQWVQTKVDAGQEHALRCEVCLEEYQVTVHQQFHWDLQRLCSAAAWTEYGNCLMVLFLLPLVFVAMWLSCSSPGAHQMANQQGLCAGEGHWTFVFIGVVLVLTFVSTLAKITHRWLQLHIETELQVIQ